MKVVRELNKITMKNVLINLLGMVLARSVLYGLNPIAIGFFAATYIERGQRGFIFFATLIGMATVMPMIDVAKYGLIMFVIMIVVNLLESKNKRLMEVTVASVASITTIIMSLTSHVLYVSNYSYLPLAILEGAVVFTLTIVFNKGIRYILYSKKGQAVNNEQIISLAIMAAICVYTIPVVESVNFSFIETAAYFVIIFMGYKYGAGAGAIAGTACGIVLGMQNEVTSIIGIMCMLGIIAGMFREVGVIGSGLAFAVSSLAFAYFYENYLFEVAQLRGLASSVVIFILLPRRILNRADVGYNQVSKRREELFVKQNIQNIARDRLKDFSDSFRKLSRTFNSIADKKSSLSREDIDHIFDHVSRKLCKDCDNRDKCWKNDFYDTYKASFSILTTVQENGYIVQEDIPANFMSRCVNIEDFVYETNKGLEMAKMNLTWSNKMAESREAIADQLGEVANIINNFSFDLYEMIEVLESNDEQIISRMKANHIEVKKISILEKRNRKQEIYMIARTERGRCITTKDAANIISGIMNKRMRPSDGSKNVIPKDYETITFVEDTKFKVLTGAARTTKAGEKVSGDNFSFIHLSNGETIMTLSDGMGSGVKACAESESVIELLEQFMEAGFEEESAIKLINSILVLKSDQQSFSTIDMGVINLHTGTCDFVKIGASSTFIKRDRWVETICSTSLPVGVLNHVDIDGITKKLYHGDFVIMVTDGVLDCIGDLDKDKFMEEMIMEITSKSPQDIADKILQKAIEQNNYIASDDMTVIVTGVWKK